MPSNESNSGGVVFGRFILWFLYSVFFLMIAIFFTKNFAPTAAGKFDNF